MSNATRMMAVSRVRNDGGDQMRYEENRRGRRMEGTGMETGRYESNRYEGDAYNYANDRYEGGYAHHDDTYDVKIRRERRGNEDMWPEDRRRSMSTYPQQRRMENHEGMPRIGFDSGEREMISFPQRGHEQMSNQRHDKHAVVEWVEGMKNVDESRGARWTMEQTEQLRKQKGLEVDPVEFWAAMNASYSDLSKLAQKYGINTMEFWVDYVMAFWFCDEDAGEHKVMRYYETFGQR